ncbi:hypothetical protein ONS95_013509 [Cadophora gregata]|uniref:uncharacterized protein n=1 Tax=Cadophora gregata TaxID=51156 RepID=UPI0026DD2C59|nr:uncharacterized protein ONS95_013509 [Cadophora gregata]KAK0099593.1 hypothetical protein ONS96_008094 [Cadophora gregata f. sp. sojae]KAK0116497.1 hypothetical protein ONS95_013509 [Cadophora gregata]
MLLPLCHRSMEPDSAYHGNEWREQTNKEGKENKEGSPRSRLPTHTNFSIDQKKYHSNNIRPSIMADPPIPEGHGAQLGSGQPIGEPAADQEPDHEAAEIIVEELGKREREKRSLKRVCGIITVAIVIYFSFVSAVIYGTPFARQFWESISDSPAYISQQQFWQKSSADKTSKHFNVFWENVNSAPNAGESVSYDSCKDRVLRYFTATEQDQPAQPTVLTVTYVRQQAEERTTASSSEVSSRTGILKPGGPPSVSPGKGKSSHSVSKNTEASKVVKNTKIVSKDLKCPLSSSLLKSAQKNTVDGDTSTAGSQGTPSHKEKVKPQTGKTKELKVHSKASEQLHPSTKQPKNDGHTKSSATKTIQKSTPTSKKGAFEKYWSAFRMQSSPTVQARKPLTAERLSWDERYRQELNRFGLEYGFPSKQVSKENTAGQIKTIYAKDREPGSKRTTDENIGKTSETEQLKKSETTALAQQSEKKISKTKESRSEGNTKQLTIKHDPVTAQDNKRVEKSISHEETMMNPRWYWKSMDKIGFPKRPPTETSAASTEGSNKAVEEKSPDSTSEASSSVPSAESVSTKTRESHTKTKDYCETDTTMTANSFSEVLKQGIRRLENTEAESTSHPEIQNDASSSQKKPGTKFKTVLGDCIADTVQDLKVSSPWKHQGKTRNDWFSTVLHFSWLSKFLADSKSRIYSLPSVLPFNYLTGEAVVDKDAFWLPWLFNPFMWTSSRTLYIRDQTAEEKAWEEMIFNSPNYQRQTPKNRTIETIQHISTTLLSVVDQLMAEGNNHLDTMTRLQEAWKGMLRGEAVMNSSRTVKEIGSDLGNRSLLKSYAGAVHQFDRLVDDVVEAASRMENVTVVTMEDAKQWTKMRTGFNEFLWEVSKRPLFASRKSSMFEGFHSDILLGGKDKLEIVKSKVARLKLSSAI